MINLLEKAAGEFRFSVVIYRSSVLPDVDAQLLIVELIWRLKPGTKQILKSLPTIGQRLIDIKHNGDSSDFQEVLQTIFKRLQDTHSVALGSVFRSLYNISTLFDRRSSASRCPAVCFLSLVLLTLAGHHSLFRFYPVGRAFGLGFR